MIQYSVEDIKIILNNSLEKFTRCKNGSEVQKLINKETKEILDLIYKINNEELKKIKRRGWDIKEKE